MVKCQHIHLHLNWSIFASFAPLGQVNSIQWHWVQNPKAFAFNWIFPRSWCPFQILNLLILKTNGKFKMECSDTKYRVEIEPFSEESHRDQKVNLVISLPQGNLLKFLSLHIMQMLQIDIPTSCLWPTECVWMCRNTHFVATFPSGSLLLICTSVLTLLTSCHCGCVCEVNPG